MFRIVVIATLAAAASGCATITRGTSESFVINTNPPGAEAHLSNGLFCKTPCSVKVKRRGDFTVKITKDGYEPVEAVVTSSIDGGGAAGMAGNVILGGVIGAGVDAGSGAMHSHKPNPLEVTLVRLDSRKADRGTASSSKSESAGVTTVANDESHVDATESSGE